MFEEPISSPLLLYDVPLTRKGTSSFIGTRRRKYGLYLKERYQQVDPTFLYQGQLNHNFWAMGVRKDIHTLLVPSVDVLRHFGISASILSQIEERTSENNFIVYIESIVKVATAFLNMNDKKKLEKALLHMNGSKRNATSKLTSARNLNSLYVHNLTQQQN